MRPDEENAEEAMEMLASERDHPATYANGSSGPHPPVPLQRSRPSISTKIPLFERASARWWNPQFASASLETQYWKCSFPQLRDRFRTGLIYICLTCALWIVYYKIFGDPTVVHWLTASGLIALSVGMLLFTLFSAHYQRFYMPTSFLCVFLLCTVTLFIFSDNSRTFMSPIGGLATSFQVVLIIYTVIPLPLYLCILVGVIYSALFELLSSNGFEYVDKPGTKLVLHLGIHLLGVHLFILTQVRQRKTFLKVGQSLLARNDLILEAEFKDHMIQSVMPKKVADELLKETVEFRRPSSGNDARMRTASDPKSVPKESNPSDGSIRTVPSAPNIRKFRPFTMNLMTNVSILFADIAGFTKMSSNKSACELVELLNDLFGRFDNLCSKCNLEKISTLGDCYYCVAGCPEPRADHARCCVEMGLAMIIAIKRFDRERKQEVNMRVGIHTGKVMCGMVGTKRFKFDVFSNDVTLANEMESTGIAGRVHLSEKTAEFLDNEYILEEGPPHRNLKTYFIAGRVQDVDGSTTRTASCSDSAREGASDGPLSRSQISFRKKLSNKLRSLHTSSLPPGKHFASPGGSLRMKLLERKGECNSAQVLHHSECFEKTSDGRSPVVEERRKSASLQALTSPEIKPLSKEERIGGKISLDLVNGSSTTSARGSKSSVQEVASDVYSIGGGIDTAISHHQNAASLTRFDTDNRDFDRRLATVIQNAQDGKFPRGFWTHNDSLNKWTLRFNDAEVESQYRQHFAESIDKPWTGRDAIGRRKITDVSELDDSTTQTQYRYSGVFIDILVSGALLLICSLVVLISGVRPLPLLIYFPLSLFAVVLILTFIGIPLLRRRNFLPFVNLWAPRHFIGMVLILLPIGVALCIMPQCDSSDSLSKCDFAKELLAQRILFSYVFLMALFAHCNFSQLGAWPKTLQGVLVGFLFVSLTFACQQRLTHTVNPDSVTPDSVRNSTFDNRNCNETIPQGEFGSKIFIWEICLDVFLTLLLIAFLNYQFEAAFRMSFYGDVQARRDTEKMQVVRDQADWLLTNILPQHVVESLKSNTKYSENHAMVAVLFATITNWSDMYEENFEGGREFLRVLNEIIGDFDELLDRPEYSHVEKIKTIGPTYMAASGLNPEKTRLAMHPHEHLYQLMEFALGLQQQLSFFNQDLLNFDFVCKIGLNIGPVTAGVIGSTKLYYDIWGDTVNIASRMYSTGVQNRIQVSQKTRDILCDRYDFEYRDHIEVKGIDGGMDTYLLVGRKGEPPITFSNSPMF